MNIKGFWKGHKREVEIKAAEGVAVGLGWEAIKAILKTAGVRVAWLGAGVASAAIVTTLHASGPPPHRVMLPPRYALETTKQHNLVRTGKRYGPGSGIVYVWGGNGPFGFDCSGYVNYVYRRNGIAIPRDSRSQWTSRTGTDVRKGHERPGDAVYFMGSRFGANAGPPPGHEGLYIGGGRFIEYYSSGRPAHVGLLRYAPGYMGAKRWWHPITVQRRSLGTIRWVIRHFRVRVSGAFGRSVTFKPWVGRGPFSLRKRRLLLNWVHATHHRYRSKYTTIKIIF